ncbi:hypothetical protein TNCV_455821 [Trichonephila clavipes]|nr:hypothetical protein TNCV_455821 [Trichonephila clavipes]
MDFIILNYYICSGLTSTRELCAPTHQMCFSSTLPRDLSGGGSVGLSSLRALGAEDLRALLALVDPRRSYWIRLSKAYLGPSRPPKFPMDEPALEGDQDLNT